MSTTGNITYDSDTYSFRGWSTSNASNAGISIAANGNYTGHKNVTYYASYQRTITITKYTKNSSNGGTYGSSSGTGTYGSLSNTATGTAYVSYKNDLTNATINVGTTSSVTDNNITYTFRGWSTSNTANATISIAANGSYTGHKNTTYYASYQATLSLSYNVNGGNSQNIAATTGIKYMSYSGSVINPTVTLTSTKPTRDDYNFEAWYSLSNGGTKIGTAGTSYTLTANKTVYAHWSIINYTISYNLRSGSVSVANPTSYNHTTTTFTLRNPTRNGYTFAGWTGSNDLASGLSSYTTNSPFYASSRDHIAGDAFNVTPGATYRIFITAKRTAGELPIQGGIWYTSYTSGTPYDGFEGNYVYCEDLGNGWARYYKDVKVPSGKTQGKLYMQLDQDGTGGSTSYQIADMSATYNPTSVSIATGSRGNKSFTANWRKNNYTVTYNYNGNGQANATATVSSGSSTILKTPNLNLGKKFSGWYTPYGTNVGTVNASYTPTSDITLTAKWETSKYYKTLSAGAVTLRVWRVSSTSSNLTLLRNYYSTNGGNTYIAFFKRINDQSSQAGGPWCNMVMVSNKKENVSYNSENISPSYKDSFNSEGSFEVDGITFYYSGDSFSTRDEYYTYDGFAALSTTYKTILDAAKAMIEDSRYN